MHQPSQAMLDHLPPTRVFGEALTFLEGPGLLQERLLGMESHLSGLLGEEPEAWVIPILVATRVRLATVAARSS